MVEVRAVGGSDAAPLRELRLRALTEAPAAFASTAADEAQLPASHWAELARQSEDADHLAIYVAIDSGRWVGMAAGRWFDREHGIAHLWGMWVDPSARGLGVGARLVGGVRSWAADHDAGFLRLGVIVDNDDASGFYERLGFVSTGEVGPFRRDPARTVRYLVRPV